jgi:hypothetical protein
MPQTDPNTGRIILTEEEKAIYAANNPDVVQAIANTQEGVDDPNAPKWEGNLEDHYNYALMGDPSTGRQSEARNFDVTTPVPEAPPPEYLTKAEFDETYKPIDYSKIPRGGGDSVSYSYTTADPVDYSRIQGFVGVPEIRDEEGNITQEATGIYAQQPNQGLMSGQQDLMTGQQTLGTGQGVLAEGQATLGEGQTALAAGQQGIMGGQQVLGEGQQAIGGAIGVASENQPQTLFGGQMALGQGQAGITSGVQGLGRDLTNLTGNLSDFESAQRQYQLAAESQRAQGREIGMTTRDQLEDQLRSVGAQTNRMAEQQAQARQQGMMARQVAPQAQQTQQASQAAQIAGQNLRSFAPQGGGMMGPTGPVAVDPRDQVGFGPTRSPV